MRRRSPSPSPAQPADLTPTQIRLGIERIEKVLARTRQFDPESITEQYNVPEVDQLSAAVDDALVRTFGKDMIDYDRYRYAADFDNGPHNYAYQVPIQNVHKSLARSKARNIALREQALESLRERLVDQERAQRADSTNTTNATTFPARKIFIAHGHD